MPHGPYANEVKRSAAARALRKEHGDEYGLHWLNVHERGSITIGDYSGGFFSAGGEAAEAAEDEAEWARKYPTIAAIDVRIKLPKKVCRR